MTEPPRALGFPAAMGPAAVAWVTEAVAQAMRAEDARARVHSIRCEEPPEQDGPGLRFALAVEVGTGGGEEWLRRGTALVAMGLCTWSEEEAIRIDVPDPEVVAREVWPCARCGADAGAVELRLGNVLRREGPGSILVLALADEDVERWRALLATGSSTALHAADPEVAQFHCPGCAADYCERCWQLIAYRDTLRGTCPSGHERMLED